jgi:hypothetical protein
MKRRLPLVPNPARLTHEDGLIIDVREFQVRCAARCCGFEGSIGGTLRRAKTRFYSLGWVRQGGLWFCPDCVTKASA